MLEYGLSKKHIDHGQTINYNCNINKSTKGNTSMATINQKAYVENWREMRWRILAAANREELFAALVAYTRTTIYPTLDVLGEAEVLAARIIK